MIEPVLEVYFDPNGFYGGKPGCFRARLRDAHGCHGAGTTPEYAVESVVRTAVSFRDMAGYENMPGTPDEYQKVRIDSAYFKPMTGDWNQPEPNADQQVQDAIQTAQIVAHILTPRRW